MIDCNLNSHVKNSEPKNFDYFQELSKTVGFIVTPEKTKKGARKNLLKFHPHIWSKVGPHVKGDLSGGGFWGNRIVSLSKVESIREKCSRCKRVVKNVWNADIFRRLNEIGSGEKKDEMASFPFKCSIGECGSGTKALRSEGESEGGYVELEIETEKVIDEEVVEFVEDSEGRTYCLECKKKIDKLNKCILM